MSGFPDFRLHAARGNILNFARDKHHHNVIRVIHRFKVLLIHGVPVLFFRLQVLMNFGPATEHDIRV